MGANPRRWLLDQSEKRTGLQRLGVKMGVVRLRPRMVIYNPLQWVEARGALKTTHTHSLPIRSSMCIRGYSFDKPHLSNSPLPFRDSYLLFLTHTHRFFSTGHHPSTQRRLDDLEQRLYGTLLSLRYKRRGTFYFTVQKWSDIYLEMKWLNGNNLTITYESDWLLNRESQLKVFRLGPGNQTKKCYCATV